VEGRKGRSMGSPIYLMGLGEAQVALVAQASEPPDPPVSRDVLGMVCQDSV